MQSSASCRAIVVDVVDGNLRHAKLIEDSLAACAVAVAVACDALVDVVVVDLGIEHSLDTSFKPELGVVDLSSRLDELGHAYAKDVAWFIALDDHICGSIQRDLL